MAGPLATTAPPWSDAATRSAANAISRRLTLAAIAMAKAANERGQHDEVKDLAEAIIDTHERESGIMEMHAAGEHRG